MKNSKYMDVEKMAAESPGSGVDADNAPILTGLAKLTREQINDGGAMFTPDSGGPAKKAGPFGGDSHQ